ncbi:hypothetical protein ElyMa_006373700, partial [Elysia marginata]
QQRAVGLLGFLKPVIHMVSRTHAVTGQCLVTIHTEIWTLVAAWVAPRQENPPHPQGAECSC